MIAHFGFLSQPDGTLHAYGAATGRARGEANLPAQEERVLAPGGAILLTALHDRAACCCLLHFDFHHAQFTLGAQR
ncbi:hypothetical protein [Streptomyces sp. NPDC002265]|uniref:hypothetical protein n=1 Tax=Streptomyces sp. NPDC002265 TaxID=3154415 RepID=UPI0033195FB7